MNCVVVDDDPISRSEVEYLISKFPWLQLKGSYESAFEASSAIAADGIDLIFLDVMMPGMSGLDLLKGVSLTGKQVIIMTVEKKYAVEAFDFEVTDFLSKPISEDRFLKVTSKAKKIHEQNSGKANHEYLFVKSDSKMIKLIMKDIFFLEADRDYVTIHTHDGSHRIHASMKLLEEKLPPLDFARVHKSYIVRLDKISEIEKDTLTINGKIIPVSPSGRELLLERIKIV